MAKGAMGAGKRGKGQPKPTPVRIAPLPGGRVPSTRTPGKGGKTPARSIPRKGK